MDMNVQELQRLNESITVCLDACRRLATHLHQVQQGIAQMSLPWTGIGATFAPTGIDPLTLIALQSRVSPWTQPWIGQAGQFGQFGQPVTPFAHGFGGFGAGHFGQGAFGGQGVFGGQGIYGQSPYVQYAQNPYAQNVPFGNVPFYGVPFGAQTQVGQQLGRV